MKTNLTVRKKLSKTLAAIALLFVGNSAVNAQAPLEGGRTYVVNGSGVDLVAPKDTFVNLMGAYAGGAYTNATGIFNAITVNGLEATAIGQVTILLAPGYSGVEASLITLGSPTVGGFNFMAANRNVVVKPAPGHNVTLTTSATVTTNNSLIRLDGVSYVTFDGESTPGQRNLNIRMNAISTDQNARIISYIGVGQNGCQSVTVKNCVLTGNSNVSGVNTHSAFHIGGTFTGSNVVRRNQNIVIENNLVEAVRHGVFARGISNTTGTHDLGLIVRNNTFGGTIPLNAGQPTTFIGGLANASAISLSAQANTLIQGNTIRNCIPTTGGFRGIELVVAGGANSLDSNININGNKIYNLLTNQAGIGIYGIRATLGTHTQPLNINISNNTISRIASINGTGTITTFNFTTGILVEDVSANAGYDISHNSINLNLDTLPNAGISACVGFGGNTSGGISLRNNLFANTGGRVLTATANPTFGYGIVVITANSPFTVISNNAFYLSDFRGGYSAVGYGRSRNRISLTEWAQYSGSTNDRTTIPPFENDTTLNLSPGAGSLLSNTGTPSSVLTDINGTTRSNTAPSIGAYEFSSNNALARYPLNGGQTYLINGTNNWPSGPSGNGSFATVADAIDYLNNFGVAGIGNVNLVLEPGYVGENKFIPSIIHYTGASTNRRVVLGIAPGFNAIVSTPNVNHVNYSSVLRFFGARFFTVDGQGLVGQRNLTFQLPNTTFANNNFYRVVSITSTDSMPTIDIAIRNSIIRGNSTTSAINTFAGIYHGSYVPPGISNTSSLIGLNNNITIDNNIIEAVRNGIFVRGANLAGAQNRNWNIRRNIIGGDIAPGGSLPTTYIGGNINSGVEQSGITLKSVAISNVDSNTIRNTISTSSLSNLFAGIRLEAYSELGQDSGLNISNNFIYNITTLTGQTVYGIRINLGTAEARAIRIFNNSITKLRSTGPNNAANPLNPAAIFIEATAVINNIGVGIYHNTINLTGTSLIGVSSSSCLYINSTIRGGVDVRNNVFTNRLGRASGTGTAYAINNLSNTSPFGVPNGNIGFNAYGVDAPNSANFIGVSNNATTNYASLTEWRIFTTLDAGSYAYTPTFLNDSMPDIDLAFAGAIFNNSFPLQTILTRDIYGNPRPSQSCLGAVQFAQTFSPLVGGNTYFINGSQNPPTLALPTVGTFATINKAIQYINANGVDGFGGGSQPINLIITSGYQGEGDTIITPLMDYPRMNINRTITLKPDLNRNDTITILTATRLNGTASLFRILGGGFFTIDGSNNGSTSRNLTFRFPAGSTSITAKVIDLAPLNQPVTNITIKNCNIIGNSTTNTINTFAGIYLGGINATPSNPTAGDNNNNRFENNYIGAVRNGIYLRGIGTLANRQDRNNQIVRNIIGGDININGSQPTNYIGGVANAAGVFLSSQGGTLVDSNVIRNMVFGSFAGYTGIELSNVSGTAAVDTGITISRNSIYNIRTSSNAANAIRMNLGNSQSRGVRIVNNAISAIQAIGTSSAGAVNVNNPFAVYLNGTGTINDLGVEMYYNSINLGPANAMVASASSACVMVGPSIRGGLAVRNNIFQNRLGASSGSANAYSVIIGSNFQIFSVSDNNNYFNGAANAINRIGVYNAGVAPIFMANLAAVRALNNMDTFSTTFFVPFVNDTNLVLPASTNSAVYAGGNVIPQVNNDILGNLRPLFPSPRPSMGANEFIGNYTDSVAPIVYDITPIGNCSNGPFSVTFRAIERTVASDTLYYRVNGGAEIAVTNPTVNGFNRTFTVPAQLANSAVEYRYSLNDGSVFAYNAIFPATGYKALSTIFSNFPITYGFDIPNNQGWTVEQVAGTTGWNLSSFGSGNLPVLSPNTGVRAAIFPASTPGSAGSISRLISPCLDFTNMQVPTVRFWLSQNADVPTLRDSVNFRVTAGGGIWSFPIRSISRVNTSLAFPGFTQVDICLSDLVGVSGVRFTLEAVSRGGNNIVLDSIVVFDDVQNLPITPNPNVTCASDSIQLTIANSSSIYTYRMFNIFDNEFYTNTFTGNNGNLTLRGWNKGVDSAYLRTLYTNTLSGCSFIMNDTIKTYVRKFFNGPFVVAGVPFNGSFNSGTFENPDGTKTGDVLRYRFNPPSGHTNAQYGVTWTIVNQSLQTANGQLPHNATFTPPSGSGNGSWLINISPQDSQRTYIMNLTYRLLPTGCDSVFTRFIKISSAPSAGLLVSGSSTFCALTNKTFINTSSGAVETLPLTYVWDFGDGQTSTSVNGVHRYRNGGQYRVKVTVTNVLGISDSDSATVTVQAAPDVSFNTSGLICATSPINFNNTSSNIVSSQWQLLLNGVQVDTSTRTSAVFALPIPDTTYSVRLTVRNANNCANDTTRQYYVFPIAVADFTTSSHCMGTNIPITNNSSVQTNKLNNTFGSEWTFGNGDIGLSNVPTYKYDTAGTFNVKLKVITNFGCVDSISKQVTVHSAPNADFSVSNLCQFSTLALANNTTFPNGLGNVRFVWNFGDNTADVTTVNPTKQFGTIGAYQIKMIATDTINFCSDTVVRNIFINEKPVAAFNSDVQACVGNNITFNNVSSGPFQQTLTYNWDFNDGNNSVSQNPTHRYLTSGNFNVRLVATTDKGCSDTTTKQLSVSIVPAVTFTDNALDPDRPWRITFSANPAGLSSYRWNFGDNTSKQGNPISNDYTIKDTIKVTLTVSDSNGCQGSVTRDIVVKTALGINDDLANSIGLNISPNPFTHFTNINFDLNKSANVEVEVYDMLGRKVSTLESQKLQSGAHQIKLDAEHFTNSSSAYIVKILVDGEMISRNIIQIK
jgi:PKD repeat protein